MWLEKLFDQSKKRIVLVEDEQETAFLLQQFLQTNNYEVHWAKDGEDALRLIPSVQPHLVILDLMLPKMDGFETLIKLKTEADMQQVPVIMCTALNQVQDVEKCYKWGAVGYITKPFELDHVLEKVKQVIHLSTTRSDE